MNKPSYCIPALQHTRASLRDNKSTAHTVFRLSQQFDSNGWDSFAMAFTSVILCPRLLTPSSFSSGFVRSGRCAPWMSFSLNVSLYWDIFMESSQLHTSSQSQSSTGLSKNASLKENPSQLNRENMSFNEVRGQPRTLHLSDPNSHFTALFQESKTLCGKDRSNRGLAGDFYGPDVRLSKFPRNWFQAQKTSSRAQCSLPEP